MVLAPLAVIVAAGLAAAVVMNTQALIQSKPRQAEFLLAQANGDQTKGARLAREVLRRSVYNPSVLSAMAMAAEKQGRAAEAARLMSVAGRLSWRDPKTNAWLFQHDMTSGNFSGGMKRADALLRVRPETDQVIVPLLARAAADPRISAAIADRLALRPRWRDYFLGEVSRKAEPGVVFDLLNRLATTSAPPLEKEAAVYVRRLIDSREYDQALLAVYLFTPSKKLQFFKNLFDGEFNGVEGIAPFTWTTNDKSGASVAMEDPPVRLNGHALHVLHNGIFQTDLVSQFMVLAPGTYELKGDAAFTSPSAGAGFEWIVSCVGSGGIVATVATPTHQNWQPFSARFDVPDYCKAQELILRSTPQDVRTSVEAWYDNIALDRAEG